MAYSYNPQRVYEELTGYDPAGVRVKLRWRHGSPYDGTIERQATPAGRSQALFVVRLGTPVPFEDHAQHMGEKEKKALEKQLKTSGFLKDGMVSRLWALWGDLEIEPKKGALVEYTEPYSEVMSTISWPGRVVGVEDGGRLVLLEVFEPTPFMDAPNAIDIGAIKKGYYSEEIWVLGMDTVNFLSKASGGQFPPPGHWSEKKHEYVLEKPLSVDDLAKVCQQYFPEESGCVFQCLILYVLPLDTRAVRGEWRPLRKELADDLALAMGREEARTIDVEEARRRGIEIEPGTESEEWTGEE